MTWRTAMNVRSSRFFRALTAIAAMALSSALHVQSAKTQAQTHAEPLGDFENHGDIGTALHSGSARFDAVTGVYTVTGSGENMWFGRDDFHFVWKKVSGDVAISADIARKDGKLHPSGASIKLPLSGEYYVGIGV